MLKTLRRIVQEVNAAHHFGEALQIMVQRIREAINTQACSVFLLDHRLEQYVLMATEGLNDQLIGQLRIPFGEGIVGFLGQREEPINLEDSSKHPHFYYCPGLGEERYKAFLGVPIIHHRELVGIMVVQQEDERRFDEAEEAFLITLSAQLAGVIAHAEATGIINRLLNNTAPTPLIPPEISLHGIPSVSGIGIGIAVVIYPLADLEAVPDRVVTDINAESELFQTALQATRADIRLLSERISNTLPQAEQALFDVYLRILDDHSLGTEVIAEIQKGQWAQGALRRVISRHTRRFETLEDDYLRERAADFRDLGRRVLGYLQARQPVNTHYPEKVVLIGEEVTPSALAEVPEGRLVGIISMRGSSNSHVAILARALGVATVMGVEGLLLENVEGREIIVDGYNGAVHITPNAELQQEYLNLLAEQERFQQELEELRNLPAQTLDGYQLSLLVNTGLAADAELSLSVGAEGIGLYRTEVPFMTRDRFPAEEEQRIIYRQLLNSFAPRKVTMRTLDVGGDKALPYFPVHEENPFLGWRGLRITLDHPEVFLMQTRAMLRASVDLNNLQIMLPMVTNTHEVDEALRLLKQAHREVLEEGANVIMPPVGVMIEVPSAVYQARVLAKRVDFLSVGSNDLTQYMLAVDRNNGRVANLYDALHPAVLSALNAVVTAAHAENKMVTICGELASDPLAVILLIAMGFDALSMNSSAVPKVKWIIRNFYMLQARLLLDEIMEFETATQIRQHLTQALTRAGLDSALHIRK